MSAERSEQSSNQAIPGSESQAKEVHQCLFCDKPIKDGKQGQESIFCEGDCQGWIHRTCACLSKKAFEAAKESDLPFFCNNCHNQKQELEIAQLRSTVAALQDELSELKSNGANTDDPPVSMRPTYSSATQAGTNTTQTLQTPFKPANDTHESERKYNIVVYGIKESTKGTSRHTRTSKDREGVMTIIHKVDNEISQQSLRDCIRLGKYDEEKCRPILAKLTRTCDISSILSNRSKLSRTEGISIKPDMTREERSIESLLLKERRQLINSGTERTSIKIRGNAIYVNNMKHEAWICKSFNF